MLRSCSALTRQNRLDGETSCFSLPSLCMLIKANQDYVLIFNINKRFNIQKMKQSRPVPFIIILVNKSKPLRINQY